MSKTERIHVYTPIIIEYYVKMKMRLTESCHENTIVKGVLIC